MTETWYVEALKDIRSDALKEASSWIVGVKIISKEETFYSDEIDDLQLAAFFFTLRFLRGFPERLREEGGFDEKGIAYLSCALSLMELMNFLPALGQLPPLAEWPPNATLRISMIPRAEGNILAFEFPLARISDWQQCRRVA